MKKKRSNDLSDLGNLIYTTGSGNTFYEDEKEHTKTLPPQEQHLEAHFSNKGRGGKTVTVIKGFSGSEKDLKDLGKFLKKQCGVGGSVKDGEIIIQGKIREKIIAILEKEGYRVKRVGG